MEIHAQEKSGRQRPSDAEGDTWLGREHCGQSSGNSVSGVQFWLRPGRCSEPWLLLSHFLGSLGAELGSLTASGTPRLSWLGDLGTRSGRGRHGAEKEQGTGPPGERLSTCQERFSQEHPLPA